MHVAKTMHLYIIWKTQAWVLLCSYIGIISQPRYKIEPIDNIFTRVFHSFWYCRRLKNLADPCDSEPWNFYPKMGKSVTCMRGEYFFQICSVYKIPFWADEPERTEKQMDGKILQSGPVWVYRRIWGFFILRSRNWLIIIIYYYRAVQ